MLGWINFFDIGLGHGLRNKLAVAFAKGDTQKAKAYVSTAYFSISILIIVLFAFFLVINQFLDWNQLLNIPPEVGENLKSLALLLFSLFAIQFVLQLINSILLGSQQPARVSLNNMFSNLIVLGAIFLLVKFAHQSLFYVAFAFSAIPVMVLLLVNIYYFRNAFKSFAPALSHFDRKVLGEVLNLGVKFFIIQISVLVFYQTSNFLICKYFSPAQVTPYNIAFRYFGIVTMVFNIITTPYWTAYTEAYVKQDYQWMQKTLRQLLRLWLVLAAGCLVMLWVSQYAYHLWVGDKVKVDFQLSLYMMIYTAIISFGNIYILVLNGIGRIKWQMVVNLIGMILFIPLARYFALTLHLGIAGIILATIVCSIYGPLIAPFEVRNMFRENKHPV
jgi:O-antigen/teichoic acid export membrane protein